MKQMVVPKVKMLPLLYGQSEGQEREAQEKEYTRLLPDVMSRLASSACSWSSQGLEDRQQELGVRKGGADKGRQGQNSTC
jgi:hypothetical protein